MSKDRLNLQAEKSKVFVRYLIQVAKEERCVPYCELGNVFDLSPEKVSPGGQETLVHKEQDFEYCQEH